MAFEIDLVTIFPDFFASPLKESLIKRAVQKKIVKIRVHNLRDWAAGPHKSVDDKPFGGGPGMVMMPGPIFECVESLQKDAKPKPWVVLLDAAGEPLTPKLARRLAERERLILICGHYEGIDHRAHEHLADQVVSVGNFVTMGGEAPALCLTEAVMRFIPGVLGNEKSLAEESFEDGLEYPQYTRPRDFRGLQVPDVLVSGNHKEVEKWRAKSAREKTQRRRPDLGARQ